MLRLLKLVSYVSTGIGTTHYTPSLKLLGFSASFGGGGDYLCISGVWDLGHSSLQDF